MLVVCAHPDDESFGLGAVLAALAGNGTEIDLLCFTHGEASTLGEVGADLGLVRAEELAAAAVVLGVTRTDLLAYPDGGLAGVATSELAGHVREKIRRSPADALLVFDEGGITGHPDHCRATAAAVSAAEQHDLDVIAWTIPEPVARTLNSEYGTTFVGRSADDIHADVPVDRARHLEAIACHRSQSTDNPVLWRRLELLGDRESLRYLLRRGRRPTWSQAREG